MLTPLAGTVSFYSEDTELIKEIDMDEYDDLTELEFLGMVHELGAHKVILKTCYHNYDVGEESILYEKRSDLTKN